MSVQSAILWSSVTQYLLKALAFASVVLIARILSPHEIGVFAIASSVVLIATEFRLLGTTNYLIRQNTIAERDIQSGLGVTILVSWSLGTLIFASAGFAASFFDVIELDNVFRILSISFLIAPFVSINSALHSRDLNFDKLALINLLTEFSRFSFTLYFILNNYSFYGLAYGVIAGALVEFFLHLLIRHKRFMFVPSFNNLLPIIKFGFYLAVTNVLARFQTSASDLVIGKMGSVNEVALFSRATGFLSFLTRTLASGIWPVALPYLSKVSRSTGGDLSHAYIHATSLITVLIWPAICVACIVSDQVVVFIFGEQWVESADIVTYLMLWGVLRISHTFSQQLFIVAHKEKLIFIKQLLIFAVLICLLVLAYPYGFEALALALTVSSILDFLLTSVFLQRFVGLRFVEYIRGLLKSFLVAFICSLTVYIIDFIFVFDSHSPIQCIFLLVIIMPFIWYFSSVIVRHPIVFELKKIVFKK